MDSRRSLNGGKTRPLSKHAMGVLRDLARGPLPGYKINPGVRDRLFRPILANVDDVLSDPGRYGVPA